MVISKFHQQLIRMRSRSNLRNLVSTCSNHVPLFRGADQYSVQHSSIIRIGIQAKRSNSIQNFRLYNLHKKFYVILHRDPNMTQIESELGSINHSLLQQGRIFPSEILPPTFLHLHDGLLLPTPQTRVQFQNHQLPAQTDMQTLLTRHRHLGQVPMTYNRLLVEMLIRLGNV